VRRTSSWLAGIAGAVLLACCGVSSAPQVTATYSIGGTASGFAGSGLVLHDSIGGSTGEDLPVSASGPFTFPTRAATGSSFEVTVKASPPRQACAVANGAGAVANADVTSVAVTCKTGFQVRVNVSGLAGSGLVLRDNGAGDLTVSENGVAPFPTALASGSTYHVSVLQQPTNPWQTCTAASPSGTVGDGDVTVDVTCTTNPYSVGVSVAGLVGSTGLVLQNSNGDELTFNADGYLRFATAVPSGESYQVTVKTQPTLSQNCRATAGTGSVAGADVAVSVTCALQRWETPAAWGTVWPDSPTMVQHAHFDGAGITEDKGIIWSVMNGTLSPPQEFKGFPTGPRFEAGPFNGPRYQATAGDGALDVAGDMLVCAVVKPDYNPSVPDGDGLENVIIAKGIQDQPPVVGAGWALRQMHDMFCFFYKSTGSPWVMVYTPTFFADRNQRRTGPINPSYMVVCAGRDGDTIMNSLNGDSSMAFLSTVTGQLDTGATPHRATIGGYDNGDPRHVFPGRVLETAAWAEPATPENIRAKYAAFAGLVLADGTVARYTRNREGPYDFTGGQLDGQYHTTWRHGPRVDPAKGMLFGLQGWNRLTYQDIDLWSSDGGNMLAGQQNPVVVTGEDLSGVDRLGVDLWTRVSGASVTRESGIHPPGDSGQSLSNLQPWADHVSLPPGASLSRAMETFDAAGPIHAMLWVRPGSATSGALTVRTTRPDPAVGTSEASIALGGLAQGWNRIWLTGLTTDGTLTKGTVFLENDGGSAIDFYAWGLDLTQIGGGGDMGAFDPGVAMYDWGAGDDLQMSGHNRFPVDVLELPAVAATTATTGFCLSVEAQPPDGLPWNAPLAMDRALAAWVDDASGSPVARLFMEGTVSRGGQARRLCFDMSGVTACADPSAWSGGPMHEVAGCASAAGAVRLYVDGLLVASASGSAPPDLASGHVLVGNSATPADYSSTTPWHGHVSMVSACRDPGGAPTGCR